MLASKVIQQDLDKKLDDIEEEKSPEPKKKPEKKAGPKNLKHRALIQYLKKRGLPTGGSMKILQARKDAYRKSKKNVYSGKQ